MKYNKTSILVVCILLACIFSIGYAAFSTTLKINGTGTISSTWSVGFDTSTAASHTNCTVITNKDSGKKTTCTIDTLTTSSIGATIAWGSPGDVVQLSARVVNSGTLNANVSMSARNYLTSNTSSACTNVTTTANYDQYNAAGTGSRGSDVTLGATATNVGPVKILNSSTTSTYNYGMYYITFTYNSSATSAAGSCTFTGTLTATQTS